MGGEWVGGIGDRGESEGRGRVAGGGGFGRQPGERGELVASDTAVGDEEQHDDDLDQESQFGREVQDVVHGSGVEHGHHGEHDDHEDFGVYDVVHAADSGDDAEENGDTAEYGYGLPLEFPGIGLVDDVFEDRDLDDLGVDPSDEDCRYEDGDDDVGTDVHDGLCTC